MRTKLRSKQMVFAATLLRTSVFVLSFHKCKQFHDSDAISKEIKKIKKRFKNCSEEKQNVGWRLKGK